MPIIALGIGIIIGLLINPVKQRAPAIIQEINAKIKQEKASFIEASNWEDIKNSKTLKDIIK